MASATDGGWVLAALIYGLLAAVAIAWAASFVIIGSRVRNVPPGRIESQGRAVSR